MDRSGHRGRENPSEEPAFVHVPSPVQDEFPPLRPRQTPRRETKPSVQRLGALQMFGSLQIESSSASTSSLKPMPISTGETVIPVRRPDKGGVNYYETVNLLANFFPFKINQSVNIKHYHLTIKKVIYKDGKEETVKATFTKESSSLILKHVQEDPLFRGVPLAFDGKEKIYCAGPVPEGPFTVKLCDENDPSAAPKVFRAIITYTKDISMNLSTIPPKNRQEIFQALEIVFRQNPSLHRLLIGRTFFDTEREWDLRDGITASTGFYQSIRNIVAGPALNVDFSAAIFHKPISVMGYLLDIFGKFWHSKNASDIQARLIGLKVKIKHRKCNKRFTVRGVTRETAGRIQLEGVDHNRNSLVDYFKDKYNLTIKGNLHCLDVSLNHDKVQYFPMEVCEIWPGQKIPLESLIDKEKFSRISCPNAYFRKKEILNVVKDERIGPLSGSLLNNYVVEKTRDMQNVRGRVLNAPVLLLGGQKPFTPPVNSNRDWNLMRQTVFDGKTVTSWAVVEFVVRSDNITANHESRLHTRVEKLAERLSKIGITVTAPPCFEKFYDLSCLRDDEQVLRILSQVWEKSYKKLQFLLCVMEYKDPGYFNLKYAAETKVGMVTQCCLQNNFYNGIPNFESQFLANLGLKINAKLGGSTVALKGQYVDRLRNKKLMFFGADVNHPSVGNKISPSVAALVGSMNDPFHTIYHTRIKYQEHRKESISDLRQMVSELLQNYHIQNRRYPEHIIFFRDGVSESQFEMVLSDEMSQLKNAIQEVMKSNCRSRLTVIIAQKRHHTRLFVEMGGDRVANPAPGTVVDTVIVDPERFDFYLNSHKGIKGTNKPTHYTVLHDENGFSSDEIQTLIYHLCYTYARCTKPVSLVTPIYYADRAAFRGRHHYNAWRSDTPPNPQDPEALARHLSRVRGELAPHESLKNRMFYF